MPDDELIQRVDDMFGIVARIDAVDAVHERHGEDFDCLLPTLAMIRKALKQHLVAVISRLNHDIMMKGTDHEPRRR